MLKINKYRSKPKTVLPEGYDADELVPELRLGFQGAAPAARKVPARLLKRLNTKFVPEAEKKCKNRFK